MVPAHPGHDQVTAVLAVNLNVVAWLTAGGVKGVITTWAETGIPATGNSASASRYLDLAERQFALIVFNCLPFH
jgi:hypothetical protein